MRELTEIELGWVAGFLEGEGSFMYHHSPTVCASQVQREPLERLETYFGGNTILKRPNKDQANQQPCWYWYAGSYHAIVIMELVYDLMSPKRKQQIDACFARWKTTKKYREQGADACLIGHKLTPENTITERTGAVRCRICRNLYHKDLMRRLRKDRGLPTIQTIDKSADELGL